MFATNITGISWTVYNIFYADHHDEKDEEIEDHDSKTNFGNVNTLKSKITARLSIR